ncbi:tyrosine-type recombinase/integrase [Halorussus lipolyticus]|uniref:tyrosine-type recombinase/integrase n=1 Tax=Halorussus lipolyticus TaxID=3034024 RepID=UPI0023E891C1|nr:site-specific integrase [Halorussus sp. DT80]
MSTTDEYEWLRVPDEYAREYLRQAGELRLSASSVRTYDSQLSEYVVFLHDEDLSVLDAEFTNVFGFVESCVRRQNRQSTIEGKVSTVRELYYYIRLRTEAGSDLQFDPLRFREIDVSRYKMPEPIQREALSREEIRRLFDAFESYRNRLMAVVAVETGLRNSDLRELQIEYLDLDGLEIHIPKPKGSKPYDVPISADLAFELDFWFRHHRGGYSNASESDFVFPSQSGEKLESNGSLNRIVREAAERAEIQEVIGESRIPEAQKTALGTDSDVRKWYRVTPHTLRHSFITLLNQAGVGLPYRQLVANHSTAETTQKYTHDKEDTFVKIRNRFDPPR